ncbi:tetratricopeptide repeat protein [Porphyromonas crevioricanis]|nr:tetratricopeptide repeat protein [Porphyromonas crevioricanis]GAD06280.1 TPR domain protein [Porphyromonas crevioricanis JCM 15906]GAD06746.1 TPR domain protein [Porphyromonas crevioricanis JCM 13913]SJZ54591.1 Tetratricopeptide repeat-containing protein [Porphyromonas crevioricanis]SQH73292.1 Putative Zn-dependent protease, contains TPR repeats [Porphyromonas crevioricanis]
MSKKELPNDKVIEEIASKSERYVEKNISKILVVVLALIAIVAGVFAYLQFVKKPKAEKAATELYMAESAFMEERDSLALNGSTNNLGLLEIAKKYSSTPSGNLSHAYIGIIYYDMGKYEEALQELKKFSASEKIVSPSIERLKGDCYVQLDKPQEAIKSFEKAAKDASNEAISPLCLLKAGRVYESLKDYDNALKTYQTIKEKYYMAPEANTVAADIIRVESLKK